MRTSIWCFNHITGYWRKERDCDQSDAEMWLSIFRADDPLRQFAISKTKPRKTPSFL
jgi:hypothetical protein